MTVEDPSPDQFYTGLVADAYAPLRGSVAPAEPYERFVRRYGEPALELGCGHGEPLLDLVAAGLDVAGLDSSADMIERAAAAATARGLSVRLYCQTMQDMDLGARFRSIYLAGPTFQLLVDLDAARRALQAMCAHLAPGGRVMVPLFVPALAPGEVGRWREHVTDGGDILAVRTVSESHRRDERRHDSVLEYRRGPADAPVESVVRTWALRWYEGDEFAQLAVEAGLRIDRTLGAHTATSAHLLAAA